MVSVKQIFQDAKLLVTHKPRPENFGAFLFYFGIVLLFAVSNFREYGITAFGVWVMIFILTMVWVPTIRYTLQSIKESRSNISKKP